MAHSRTPHRPPQAPSRLSPIYLTA
jgi:hypothetical protein